MVTYTPHSNILAVNVKHVETSLVIQWLRLHSPNTGGPGSIPGQRSKFYMPQLKKKKVHHMVQQMLKIPQTSRKMGEPSGLI